MPTRKWSLETLWSKEEGIIILVGAIYGAALVISYLGIFSWSQGVLLAFIFYLFIEFWILPLRRLHRLIKKLEQQWEQEREERRREREEQKEFEPFYVEIQPQWKELLTDYKLIKGEKEWEELREIIREKVLPGYHVLRNGISFTVLAHDPSTPPGGYADRLVYWNGRNSFSRRVDFREWMGELKLLQSNERRPIVPTFYVKRGVMGYELGIETSEFRGEEIIATIPYEIFYSWYGIKPSEEWRRLSGLSSKSLDIWRILVYLLPQEAVCQSVAEKYTFRKPSAPSWKLLWPRKGKATATAPGS